MGDKKSMRIRTAYVVDLAKQVTLDSSHQIVQSRNVDRKLMEHTNAVCLDALKSLCLHLSFRMGHAF